ncbi:MAG: hypothetical protein KA124_07380 [Luteimonas sp.]|nr:hypothetical protein [Luteimonas sp.]
MAAVIAALIGLLALVVSGYTAILQRQQVRAEVWPMLQPAISPSRRTISIENKGVGPAVVRSLKVYVDGHAKRNWQEVMDALGLPDLRDTPSSTVNGIVIAAGETIQQLSFADDEAGFQRFYRQYPRIRLQACYCSTLDECWMLDEREPVGTGRRSEVAACPAVGSDQFVDNELLPPPPEPSG